LLPVSNIAPSRNLLYSSCEEQSRSQAELRHRAPYQVIHGRLDELAGILMGVRPVDLFPDKALVHIHHGDEAIDTTPDGRVVPSKSNYIRSTQAQLPNMSTWTSLRHASSRH
jgi:hypothetical protein